MAPRFCGMSAPTRELEIPPDPPAPRRRRTRRILLVVGLVLVLVVGAAVKAGAVIVHRFDHAVTRAPLLLPSARAAAPPTRAHSAVVGPLNFLMLGSDYRVDDPEMGQRSDTIIVAHLTKAMDKVYLVSIPRDLLVDIPPNDALDFAGDRTKINAAFQFGHGGVGGAQLVGATLTNLTGVRFDGAVSVDFAGMVHAVDLFGGVTMCVDTPVVSIHTERSFQPGCQVMSSDVVLDYLRQRDFPDGDFTRQRHQQQFLSAVFDEVLSAGTLANPVRLDSLLQQVAASMTVDLGPTDLPDLLFALRGLGPGDLTGLKVPFYFQTIGEQAFVIASDEADGLWDALRDDTLGDWTATHEQWQNKI
jgi:LCP family protein required for cell wall assembly